MILERAARVEPQSSVTKLKTQLTSVGRTLASSGRTASRQSLGSGQVEEEHYFAVPFPGSEDGLRLHVSTLRPPGVPAVNDLPKRKIFHVPSALHWRSVAEHVTARARDAAAETQGRESSLERLSKSALRWMAGSSVALPAVGGLVALQSPWLGGGIATLAFAPAIVGALTAMTVVPAAIYGKRRRVHRAEVAAEHLARKELSGSDVAMLVNPLLAHLLMALDTSEEEYDPLFDEYDPPESVDVHTLTEVWEHETIDALRAVYGPVCEDPSQIEALGMGPEDVRWLEVLFERKRPTSRSFRVSGVLADLEAKSGAQP